MSERMIENPSRQPSGAAQAAPPLAPVAAALNEPIAGPAASRAVIDERVSTMLADRACTRCAFNLIGQPIVRERHYGMLIARCPECGTVAALQEYPALGRWANRWAALLAGLWFLLITGGTFAIAGIVTGFTHGTGYEVSENVARVIRERHNSHLRAQGKDPAQVGDWWISDTLWWDAQDKKQILDDAGGILGATRWKGFAMWIFAACILVPVGATWSVLMAHRRGLALLATLLPMVLFAGVFLALSNLGGSSYYGIQDLALRMLWPVVVPLCLVCAAISLAAGALLGRPLARLTVRATLPPRLRVPLGWLWTCDGLPPPRAGG